MANAHHTIRMLPMISVEDVMTLKSMGLIGKLKRGITEGTVLLYKNARETNGFVVMLRGSARAKLLSPSVLDRDVLEITAKNMIYTMYKAVPLEIDLEPLYSAEELADAR